ncbi:hypothetical protein COLO4_36774 [Corchorus olitorius]|uniref:BHLH domain-containing protein n=1 Tax=Corchorus olitorius TaxID=93759 RepID=A0A1R3G5H9_9ROSI|nr:hypothetical protein COLO4_36774 [Corchorus olitorius]
MKTLFSKLFNLLPPHPTKMSIPELVEHATIYVTQVQKRMEELKQMKVRLEISKKMTTSGTIVSPVISITDLGSTIEVNVMAGMDMRFVLCDIISILEEEGAQVVNAAYHNLGNMILLSIHSTQVASKIGVENFQVHERLTSLQLQIN